MEALKEREKFAFVPSIEVSTYYFSALYTAITCNYIRQDSTLKLFSLIFHKIYERLIKNNVSNIKISKEPIKPKNISYLKLHVTCQHIKICILTRHTCCKNLVEYKTSYVNGRQ